MIFKTRIMQGDLGEERYLIPLAGVGQGRKTLCAQLCISSDSHGCMFLVTTSNNKDEHFFSLGAAIEYYNELEEST